MISLSLKRSLWRVRLTLLLLDPVDSPGSNFRRPNLIIDLLKLLRDFRKNRRRFFENSVTRRVRMLHHLQRVEPVLAKSRRQIPSFMAIIHGLIFDCFVALGEGRYFGFV